MKYHLPQFLIFSHCQSSPTYKSTRTKAFLSIKLGKLSSQRLNRSRQMKVSTFHNAQSTDTVMIFLDVLLDSCLKISPKIWSPERKKFPQSMGLTSCVIFFLLLRRLCGGLYCINLSSDMLVSNYHKSTITWLQSKTLTLFFSENFPTKLSSITKMSFFVEIWTSLCFISIFRKLITNFTN